MLPRGNQGWIWYADGALRTNHASPEHEKSRSNSEATSPMIYLCHDSRGSRTIKISRLYHKNFVGQLTSIQHWVMGMVTFHIEAHPPFSWCCLPLWLPVHLFSTHLHRH